MKNILGNALTVTLFGESHGVAIGAVIDGIAPGVEVDREYIAAKLSLRRPSGKISTARREMDEYIIESGVYDGKTTGTPICILIPNADTHSKDYSALAGKARPGHSDYPAYCKYHGFEDARGGGHFSGRITAPIVAAGALIQAALKRKGIYIGTHISRLAGIEDAKMCPERDVSALEMVEFPVLDSEAGERMHAAILEAREDLDSVGGVLETAVVGMPAGVGEPWFDTVESVLSHALFSIPAVKGVEFGDGFALADMKGSQANDPYRVENGKIVTTTNHMGGIGGGITNGMPIVFRCALKPTPSIAKTQQTVDFVKGENTDMTINGRHDPCIVHRARAVVDAIAALTLADLLTVRYGTDWLAQ
ncbi:MAG: chorismate synthase [Clostridia bacterium]|nr:chorismate synthase [Clostridia bacterium]